MNSMFPCMRRGFVGDQDLEACLEQWLERRASCRRWGRSCGNSSTAGQGRRRRRPASAPRFLEAYEKATGLPRQRDPARNKGRPQSGRPDSKNGAAGHVAGRAIIPQGQVSEDVQVISNRRDSVQAPDGRPRWPSPDPPAARRSSQGHGEYWRPWDGILHSIPASPQHPQGGRHVPALDPTRSSPTRRNHTCRPTLRCRVAPGTVGSQRPLPPYR